jgi:hypothetical protein
MFENHNQLVAGTTGVLLQQIAKLQGDNGKLEATVERLRSELIAAKESDDARMMEALSREKADARKDHMVGKLMQLMPVVAAKFMGKDGAAAAPSPLSMLVGELAASIQKDQTRLYKFMMLLTLEERILFGNIVQMASGNGPANGAPANGAGAPPADGSGATAAPA